MMWILSARDMHLHKFLKLLPQSMLTSLWEIQWVRFCVKYLCATDFTSPLWVCGIINCSSWHLLRSWLPWLHLLSLPLSVSLCCLCLRSLLLPLKHWNSLDPLPGGSHCPHALCQFHAYGFHIFPSSSHLILGLRVQIANLFRSHHLGSYCAWN